MGGSKSAPSERPDPVQEVRDYYESILSSLMDGVVAVDEQCRITIFSTTAEQISGLKRESVQGKSLFDSFPESSPIGRLAAQSLRTGRSYLDSNPSLGPYLKERRDIGLATSPLLDSRGNIIGVVIVFRDLSRLKALEARLRKGERLASLGVLAAGMAHEIKNPLGGIRGASQLLREEFAPENPSIEFTDIIIREVDRLNQIVQGLLDFSKPQEPRLAAVNIHEILSRVIALVEMENPAGALWVERLFDPSLPDISGDADQLTQVFLNILQNGIDAMVGSGTLTLTTRVLSGFQIRKQVQEKVRMICVDVEDSGCGIAPDEIGSIFDPFYTRKPDGVGLGLALCYRIVEDHGGKIDVESRPGEGTRFSVSLPMAP
jgi:two-component system nitrogen regulation sensor histidine kinase GlnL